MEFIDVSVLTAIVGVLTLGTNVITEVLKRTVTKIDARVTALIVAMALTLTAFFGYAAVSEITVEWYMVAGAVVTGFFVSYAAQFGFDKLKELIAKYTGRK